MPKFQQDVVKEAGPLELQSVVDAIDKKLKELPKLGNFDNVLSDLKKMFPNKSVSYKDFFEANVHFFYRGSDWYIGEWDGKDTLYGYTILNGDRQNMELGYISLTELTNYKGDKFGGIELDFYWTPKTIRQALKEDANGLNGKKRKGLGEKVSDKKDAEKVRIFGTVVARKKENTNDAFRKFNNDEVDVLMINQSGSTGASAHAVPTRSVPANKVRQRVMIVLQAELDINTEVQKRGRINRTGQILLPIYDYLTSAIPAEKRLMMMLQKKLKSLDANTSANQKNSEALMKSEDFLNKYGDKVVKDFLKENPKLNLQLGDPLKLNENKEDSGKSASPENAAHKVSGRVAVLDTKQQEKFYTTILEKYHEYVLMLIEEDRYDLEVEVQDLKARTLRKEFKLAGRGGVSPFGDNTYLEACEVNVLRKPLSTQELDKALKDALKGKTGPEIKQEMLILGNTTIKKQIVDETKEIQAEYAKKIKNITKEKAYQKLVTVQTKIDYEKNRKVELETAQVNAIDKMDMKYSNEWTFVKQMIDYFMVGRILNYPDDFELNNGSSSTMAVCLGVKIDLKKERPFAPGNVGLRIVIASSRRSITFGSVSGTNAQRILAIKGASMQNYIFNLPTLMQKWADAIQANTKNRNTRYILTGNLLQAFSGEMPKGRLIQFSTIDNKQRKGVLLPESFNKQVENGANGEMTVTVPIGKVYPLIQSMGRNAILKGSNTIAVMLDYEMGRFKIVTSSAVQKAGNIFLDQDILKLVDGRNFEKTSDKMIATVQPNKMQDVLDLLQNVHGVTVEVSAFDFKKIEHQFQQNQYSDEIRPLKQVERPPMVEETRKSDDNEKQRKLTLKYKYKLKLIAILKAKELNN